MAYQSEQTGSDILNHRGSGLFFCESAFKLFGLDSQPLKCRPTQYKKRRSKSDNLIPKTENDLLLYEGVCQAFCFYFFFLNSVTLDDQSVFRTLKYNYAESSCNSNCVKDKPKSFSTNNKEAS